MEQMPVNELVEKLCPGAAVIFQNKNAAIVEHRGGLKFIQCDGTVWKICEEVLEEHLPK